MNPAFWPSFKTSEDNTTDETMIDPDRIDCIDAWEGAVRVTYQSLTGKSESVRVYESLKDVQKKLYNAFSDMKSCS